MKTYVLEVIKRIKRFSEKFDVSSTLCDKTWVVFNDTGERELYIFQPNGSVIITKNGVGIKGKWEWISTNKSLVINSNDKVIMLHPEYIDKTILALNLDGTQKMAFLIEQGNKEAFAAKTLAQLEQYFENKEKLLIAEQNRKIAEEERKRIEEERRRTAEEERRRIEEAKKIEQNLKLRAKEREKRYKNEAKILEKELNSITCTLLTTLLVPLFSFLLAKFLQGKTNLTAAGCWLFFIIIFFILISIAIVIDHKRSNKRLNKWKDEHPNDPRKKYLD